MYITIKSAYCDNAYVVLCIDIFAFKKKVVYRYVITVIYTFIITNNFEPFVLDFEQ